MNSRVSKSWLRYEGSREFLAGGTSTNSKAAVFEGSEPAVVVKGKGCRVWDCDGNEYIDFRNGLGPVSLGYCVEEIDCAIREQLEKGIVFGHPHVIEGEVAELLVDVIPCAERVRFLKTGGEANAACIKIARDATGRKKILQCGYNGWLNSLSAGGFRPGGLVGSDPCRGVPDELSALHCMLPWAELDAWEECFEKDGDHIAAVMISCEYAEIAKGGVFLPAIRELTQRYGALMIMDEIVTGFRLAIGGAHEYFDFLPDMAVFAKGLANGMPLSVYVGRADLVDRAVGLGISSTFGGEALSLAAAKACIEFYHKNDVIGHLWKVGGLLWSGVDQLFRDYGIGARTQGFAVCPGFVFEDPDVRTRFFEACYRHGVCLYSVPYVNFSHKASDIEEALGRIEKALVEIKST